jgi:hypothetical protein
MLEIKAVFSCEGSLPPIFLPFLFPNYLALISYRQSQFKSVESHSQNFDDRAAKLTMWYVMVTWSPALEVYECLP